MFLCVDTKYRKTKPLKRSGEAFHPCVVQDGFGTESAVDSVGGCTILLFSVILLVCHIVSSERVPIFFFTECTLYCTYTYLVYMTGGTQYFLPIRTNPFLL